MWSFPEKTPFWPRFGFTDVQTQLYILAALTVLIFALESAFQYAYQVLWRNLAQVIQHEMRVDAYGHVQELELAYFEDQSTGGLMSILNNDINQLERFLNGGASEILRLVTSIVVIMGIFFYTAPSVAWMAALPMPFIIWGSIRFQTTAGPAYTPKSARWSAFSTVSSPIISAGSPPSRVTRLNPTSWRESRIRVIYIGLPMRTPLNLVQPSSPLSAC